MEGNNKTAKVTARCSQTGLIETNTLCIDPGARGAPKVWGNNEEPSRFIWLREGSVWARRRGTCGRVSVSPDNLSSPARPLIRSAQWPPGSSSEVAEDNEAQPSGVFAARVDRWSPHFVRLVDPTRFEKFNKKHTRGQIQPPPRNNPPPKIFFKNYQKKKLFLKIKTCVN